MRDNLMLFMFLMGCILVGIGFTCWMSCRAGPGANSNICRRKSDGKLFTATIRDGYNLGDCFADMFTRDPGWYFKELVFKRWPWPLCYVLGGHYVKGKGDWETRNSNDFEILEIDGKWKEGIRRKGGEIIQ